MYNIAIDSSGDSLVFFYYSTKMNKRQSLMNALHLFCYSNQATAKKNYNAKIKLVTAAMRPVEPLTDGNETLERYNAASKP